jgi:DMSO/TMAO reductase YedYZ molybdopterin-dependent catalytic subunit
MPNEDMQPARSDGRGVGVRCAVAAVAAAELTALAVGQGSPLVSVAGAAIDASPEWLKSFAIRTFGTADKAVLLVGIVVVVGLLAAAVGRRAVRRRVVGDAALVALGAVGALAALTRPGAGATAALPSLLGTVAGALVLRRAVPGHAPGPEVSERPELVRSDRRAFLRAGLLVGSAAVAATVAVRATDRRSGVSASRDAVRLPVPDDPASAVPSGIDPAVEGLEPYFTPNDRFYRVDTALFAPRVEAAGWRLRIHGMVDRELELGFDDLLTWPTIERDITLACISNEVGGRYVGNARWIGVRLNDVLDDAGVDPRADQLVSRSVDGFTVGTPTAIALDGRDAMLAFGMNGESLPVEHGFPVRMVIPGLYGYNSATKWVVDLELTTFDAYDAYWVERGWARYAPIETQARIDTPTRAKTVTAGQVPVAGVAWAQHRGITAVQVRVDGGPWMPARLAPEPTLDAWRQWVFTWDAQPGSHTLEARATDGDGNVQTGDRSEPFPDGATGWHAIAVTVA